MELKQLQELFTDGKFKKEEILKLGTVEDLFFMITESTQSKEANYNSLYPIFEALRELNIEAGGMNTYTEYLTLKFYYLMNVFNVEEIILNALMEILGPVVLDFELENRYFEEDKFAKFYLKRYENFKSNNELSMVKMLTKLDANALKTEGEEFAQKAEDLKVALGLK